MTASDRITTPVASRDEQQPLPIVRIVFDRIGRTHDVAPLDIFSDDPETICDEILKYARPHLRSHDVEVSVDTATWRGIFFCGFNNGGTFTVEWVTA